MNNKLVKVVTSDGLDLHGYYIPTEDKEVALLHIHGFEGNFYENDFVYTLAEELEKSGISFLTVNTRGNGRDTSFSSTKGIIRIGARYELLEESHLDISAWIKFLIDEGYKNIILQGHSLGTMKVVRYLFEGEYKEKVNKLILLAPFDKLGYMKSTNRNVIDLLNKAQEKVDAGDGEELITTEFEDIVFSYNTFISWYKQDDLGRMFEFCNPNYDFPILKGINIPTKIIVGSKDEYFYLSNPDHPEEAMDTILKHIPVSQGFIIKDAVHSFKPYENILAQEVINFI